MSKKLELQPGDNILLCRTDRLGDLVLALPFFETVKLRYPDCRVDVLASLYASPILENNDRIDKIVRVQNDQLFSNKLYRKDLLHRLKMGNYKAVVALFPERQICRLFYKAGIPARIGTAGRFHSVFFSHHLFHSRKANKKHEFEYNLDFLSFFRDGETVATPRVYPKEREINNAKRILREVYIEGDFTVLHPGSGGSADGWPFEKFLELFSLLKQSGRQVVISGSEDEGEKIRKTAEKLNMEITEITGLTDLRTLGAVLSLAETVVANSTGPLHLAAAVGTEVVGLYPSKVIMSPVRWGPLGKNDRVIQPAVPMCTCPAEDCHCMNTITVDQVAREVLDGTRQTP
jgi:ADP-heptose:LPS heptosyltransferase